MVIYEMGIYKDHKLQGEPLFRTAQKRESFYIEMFFEFLITEIEKKLGEVREEDGSYLAWDKTEL